MITIDQLLESVDLDFEPRWVTKDKDGEVCFWRGKPKADSFMWCNTGFSCKASCGKIKLSEFAKKNWTKCIYEVPRKTTGKIEKLQPEVRGFDEKPSMPNATDFLNKINELVDAVNELKGAKK